ncbi:MAG: uracil phosphoribosyltransferase [Methylocystaceae bacterium]
MESVTVLDHPLAGNFLCTLRNKETRTEEFRMAMEKLGLLLAIEATRDLPTEPETVVTPLEVEAVCPTVKGRCVALVPILRAGLGFVNSFHNILPAAKVAHIGVARDHVTFEARTYLNTLPENNGEYRRIFVLDPMLATGNSSVSALKLIIEKGYSPNIITLVTALSVMEGIDHVKKEFPDIKIITGVIDPYLNDKAYIVPGLGDAGDRLNLL